MKKQLNVIKALFLLSVLVVTCVTSISAAIPDTERAALIALYNATDGKNWRFQDGWKEGTLEADGFGPIGSEGNWYGIKVENDHVTAVEIFNNNMYGQLPPQISDLSQLNRLDLHSNKLSGPIPPEICDLSKLSYLFLGGNLFSGTIPAGIGKLSNLEYLNLISTLLEGVIPAEIGNLSELKEIHIYYTAITGPLPPELGKLGQLNTLYLFSNAITGSIPPELGNLSSLRDFAMYDNQLTGSIPAELGNLTQLHYLNLSRNQLTGPLPAELSTAEKLSSIELSFNQITGSIPSQWGDLSNLSHLVLDKNQLSGNLPAELGKLSNLNFISLSYNTLSGPLPAELGTCSALSAFNLSHNALSGSIPAELAHIPWLYEVDLSHNQLSGNIPEELGTLVYLQELRLSSNQLSGEIPASFVNLSQLWENFSSLSYNGLSCNNAEIQAFLNIYFKEWQATQTTAPTQLSVKLTSATSAALTWQAIPYTGDNGKYIVYKGLSSTGPWDQAGETLDKMTSSFEVTGLLPETTYYFNVSSYTDAHAENQNAVTSRASQTVSITTPGVYTESEPPFGSFDTPLNNSGAAGSIPVTGWALDDSGFVSVKIYRYLENRQVFIGDAVFVEGARPDVAAAFPEYPFNTKGGWGYMLLTNFLPNNGNGTYVLEAVATDLSGKHTSLGTKTIHCDNAHAVKPFGAIDTPTQGGLASGSAYINWGWVLTPQPNAIPIDGSTIDVWIDGVNAGHPTYDIFRQDISDLFPGYANSEGAVGYFYIDTTAYQDGLHTIQWTVKDDAGNFDGIGSRYFSISSSQKAYSASATQPSSQLNRQHLPGSIYPYPLRFRKGYSTDTPFDTAHINESNAACIAIRPLERLEIQFTGKHVACLSLPTGSAITEEQAFVWQPGPGYSGTHHLVFHITDHSGAAYDIDIIVYISLFSPSAKADRPAVRIQNRQN